MGLDVNMSYLQIIDLEEYNTTSQEILNQNAGIEILNPSENFVIKSNYDPIRKITGHLYKIYDLNTPDHQNYQQIYGKVNSENLVEIGDYGLANKSFTSIIMKDAYKFQRLGCYALLNSSGIETNTTYMPPVEYEINEGAFGGNEDTKAKTIIFTSVPIFKYKNGNQPDYNFFNNLCGPNTNLYIKDQIFFEWKNNKWTTSLQELYNATELTGNILDCTDQHNQKKSGIKEAFNNKYGDFFTVSENNTTLASVSGYFKITIKDSNSQPNE